MNSNKSSLNKYIITGSLLLLVLIVQAFSGLQFSLLMIPVFLIVFFLILKVPTGDYSVILCLLLTGAVGYVIYCRECTGENKSVIFTLWLGYLCALLTKKKTSKKAG